MELEIIDSENVVTLERDLGVSTNQIIRLLRITKDSADDIRNSLNELRSRTTKDDYAKALLSIAYQSGLSKENPKQSGRDILTLFVEAYKKHDAELLREVLWKRPQYQMDRETNLLKIIQYL